MGALECEDRSRALRGKRERQREGEGRVQGSWSRPLSMQGRSTWSVVCRSHHLPKTNSATGMQSAFHRY